MISSESPNLSYQKFEKKQLPIGLKESLKTNLKLKSVQEQVREYVEKMNGPVTIVSVGNLIVKDEDGMRISLLNFVQKLCLGRQKLIKFLHSIPGISFQDEEKGMAGSAIWKAPSTSTSYPLTTSYPLSASYPLSTYASHVLSTPISTFLRSHEKLRLKERISQEYFEFLSPPPSSTQSQKMEKKTSFQKGFTLLTNPSNPIISKKVDLVETVHSDLSLSTKPDLHWFLPSKLIEFQR